MITHAELGTVVRRHYPKSYTDVGSRHSVRWNFRKDVIPDGPELLGTYALAGSFIVASATYDHALPDREWPGALAACNAWNSGPATGCYAYLALNSDEQRAEIGVAGAISVESGLSPGIDDFVRSFPTEAMSVYEYLRTTHQI